MNLMIVYGHVGQEPELRHTQSGKAVANFTIATSERNNETQWFRVTVWERQAELCKEYVRQGDKITVQGRMRSRKADDGREFWDLIAERVEFAGKRDSQREPTPKRSRHSDPPRRRDANDLYRQNLLSSEDVVPVPLDDISKIPF